MILYNVSLVIQSEFKITRRKYKFHQVDKQKARKMGRGVFWQMMWLVLKCKVFNTQTASTLPYSSTESHVFQIS